MDDPDKPGRNASSELDGWDGRERLKGRDRHCSQAPVSGLLSCPSMNDRAHPVPPLFRQTPLPHASGFFTDAHISASAGSLREDITVVVFEARR
ncbi:hypothetical protein Hypma_012090 [Hypsizygus marmoreus]|uniref:Uncharacterized protein n=1 Tax=Hypsizygus marmoreus TaxID=39966 RepID=A0A369JJP7_HYPMA|nr:hypothetical protein Hypma_012090 [Hypsizygus marmoreus]